MKDREIFVIGDTHFGHENILKFKSGDAYLRNFSSIKEHDECICDNWLSVVRDNDIVYVLGDVYFKDPSALSRLNGRKRLILGNHDNPRDQNLRCFQKIQMWRMFPEYECVLTHVPIYIDHKARYSYNIHGHIHDKTLLSYDHFCVSCEQINYTPVKIQDVLNVKKEV